jgi:uncharacterized protein RhaS with RHS repeats
MHYNYYRDYYPGVGRYLQPDPIGLRGGLNPYTYAYNDAINFVDKDGGVISKAVQWVVRFILKKILTGTAKKTMEKILGEEEIDYPPLERQMDTDTDGDGLKDYVDNDDDGDGIPDGPDKDRDNDGIPDKEDPDSIPSDLMGEEDTINCL